MKFSIFKSDVGQTECLQWLVDEVKMRNKMKRNANIVFVGDTGSGKSALALELCRRVDEGFNIDRVLFDPEPFFKLIPYLPQMSFVQFDEGGVSMDAQLWSSAISKMMRWVAQTFRYKIVNLAICLPDFTMLDRTARLVTHALIELHDWGAALVYRVVSDHLGTMSFDMVGEVYGVSLPPEELWKAYEEKKQFAFDVMLENIKAELGMMKPKTKRIYSEDKFLANSDKLVRR